MLKYQRKSQINTNMLLLNGGGVLIAGILGVYALHSMFTKEVIPSCAGQFAKAMRLGVETANGNPMSPIELQSRAGMREWGVLENAKVVRIKNAPAPAVLEVKLARSKTAPEVNGAQLSGIGMTWVPPGLASAEAACLSYDVWVPADFDFGASGTLPGIYGGARPDVAAVQGEPVKPGFSGRLAWNSSGIADPIAVLGVGNEAGRQLPVAPGFAVPRDRWFHVDQEIVLNSAKGTLGSYRLWVDGTLKVANMAVAWRPDDQMRIGGVFSDIVYKGEKETAMLRLTPPVVGWR